MKSSQKIIKYIAIAFGAFLAVNIIGAILFAVLTVGTILTGINLWGGGGRRPNTRNDIYNRRSKRHRY